VINDSTSSMVIVITICAGTPPKYHKVQRIVTENSWLL